MSRGDALPLYPANGYGMFLGWERGDLRDLDFGPNVGWTGGAALPVDGRFAINTVSALFLQ